MKTVHDTSEENEPYPVTLKKWNPYRKGKCDAMYSKNLVQRQFIPDSLNSIWAGDITYTISKNINT